MKSEIEVNKKQKSLDQFDLALNVLRDQFKELLDERNELKVHESVLLAAYESASLELDKCKISFKYLDELALRSYKWLT